MARYLIAPAAERDVESILIWTHERFGEVAMDRYGKLLAQAILDVAADANRPGATLRPEIASSIGTYHLYHSRNRPPKNERVKNPRHFLLFRTERTEVLEILRVLHDSVELSLHLPQAYRRGESGGEGA
jgi:toxin ParE1/3/4